MHNVIEIGTGKNLTVAPAQLVHYWVSCILGAKVLI